jgi:hypothetical protein
MIAQPPFVIRREVSDLLPDLAAEKGPVFGSKS